MGPTGTAGLDIQWDYVEQLASRWCSAGSKTSRELRGRWLSIWNGDFWG